MSTYKGNRPLRIRTIYGYKRDDRGSYVVCVVNSGARFRVYAVDNNHMTPNVGTDISQYNFVEEVTQ